MGDRNYVLQRNDEIENLLQQNLDNLDSWSIYADWLQERGDPRGKVMALELALEFNKVPKKEMKNILNEIKQFYNKHQHSWIGQELLTFFDEGKLHKPWGEGLFRFGFVSRIRVVTDQKQLHERLKILIKGMGTKTSDLSLVRSLDLVDNNLTKLPDIITKLTQLKQITIEDNNLTDLPKSIGNLKELSWIDLNGNKLKKLPDSIGNLKYLERLDLSGNDLKKLPDSIDKLGQLKFLDLSYNRIKSLPKSIGELTNLVYLNLTENRLSKLPDSIGNLTQLTKLYLFENKLTRLPTSMGKLKNLTELGLEDISIY